MKGCWQFGLSPFCGRTVSGRASLAQRLELGGGRQSLTKGRNATPGNSKFVGIVMFSLPRARLQE